MSAGETFDLGYGDCKALTTFTAAAMRYAGIEAYPALVYGGDSHPEVDPNLPMSTFNHVILCLPELGDTKWLECTSNIFPFGYLSNFTDDRYALLLTAKGGKLVRTTVYPASVNETVRNTFIDLDTDGSASVLLNCAYHNLAIAQTGFYRQEFLTETPLTTVKREVNLASFDLKSYDSQLFEDGKPLLKVSCLMEARIIGQKVGQKKLIKPFLIRTPIPDLKVGSARELPVIFKHGYEFTDTVVIAFPPGMTWREPPNDLGKTGAYGSISLKWTRHQTKSEIQIVRSIRLNSGKFPADEYHALAAFLQEIRGSQEIFVVFE